MFIVLLNPASGAGGRQEIAEEVEAQFLAAHVPFRIARLESAQEIPAAVHAALEDKPTAIVAGGGDGTVNAVASGMVGSPVPLGVLALGTLNHFAKDLHIPLDLPSAVQTIARARVTRVDVGCVNDRIFLNNSSIGIYPDILERREQLRADGHAKWPAMLLATVNVLRRSHEMSVRLEVDGRQIVSRTPFLFVGNNEYLVEGIRLGARPRIDAGRIYAYLAPRVRTRHLPRLFVRAVLGRAGPHSDLETLSATELWVDTPTARQIKLACDGELLTLTSPLHYRSWPSALSVIV